MFGRDIQGCIEVLCWSLFGWSEVELHSDQVHKGYTDELYLLRQTLKYLYVLRPVDHGDDYRPQNCMGTDGLEVAQCIDREL